MLSETHVLPSYSNIGSHPVGSQFVEITARLGPYRNSLGLLLVLSCPAKVRRAAKNLVQEAHISSALEDDWLVARTFTVRKCAYSLGRLVWKPGEEIIEPFKT